MRRSNLFLSLAIGLGLGMTGSAFAQKAPAKAPAKAAPKNAKAAPKKAPPKKVVVVTGEKKKKLAALFAGFKFGMSKDQVVGTLAKELDERYEEKIKTTTDVAMQDRLRKEKKNEVARIAASYVSFEGKKGGWDTSIIEDEFAHNTGEAMLERWENKDGKNNRRFFFFKDGKLYKMFVSLDVSVLPEDKKNFETFAAYTQAMYGPGAIDGSTITWTAGEFNVRAVDKLKSFDAIALAIEEPATARELVALRESKAPPKKDTSPIIKSVIDKDGGTIDTKSNGNAVDAVIKAQGGGKK